MTGSSISSSGAGAAAWPAPPIVAVAALAALAARSGAAVLASLWRAEGDGEGRALPAREWAGAAGRG
eukprot:9339788-Alexandrium_andersonii.AAC.1